MISLQSSLSHTIISLKECNINNEILVNIKQSSVKQVNLKSEIHKSTHIIIDDHDCEEYSAETMGNVLIESINRHNTVVLVSPSWVYSSFRKREMC